MMGGSILRINSSTKTNGASVVLNTVMELADSDRAASSKRFFKTAPGDYAHGDMFLGLTMPMVRRISRQFADLPMIDVNKLLASKFHEVRLAALLILVAQFERGDQRARRETYRFYLRRTDRINNWDLVDASAHQIVGGWLINRSRRPLHRLARSADVWERRIAIIATYHFIRHDDLEETFALADDLIADDHDLIQKAVGWMLRETGKRRPARLADWLRPRYRKMPRTMLRCAIEKFPESLRQAYLKGGIIGAEQARI